MPDDVVIGAEGLGKKYVIGHEVVPERYTTLRDVVARGVRNTWRKAADVACGRALVAGGATEDFWALRDVGFEVRRGEVLGIIGHNGAGKSTLLKILSRITEPSAGCVTIKGRVASLLEVGTGFHPELTGRENIYLNGAILGMSRSEIRRKFDEIVAFAEVEKFLDTPVKRFSSGMYVRLAFAVAAHLEPEILVVDEVLAVGDIEFQRKCLGKMQDVSSTQGRTVLFVSHNLAAISGLCDSALMLSRGRCIAMGKTETVVQEYLRDVRRPYSVPLNLRNDRKGSGDLRVLNVCLEGKDNCNVAAFQCGMKATLHFLIGNQTDRDLYNVGVSVGIDNEMGQRVALLDTELVGSDIPVMAPGCHGVRMTIPRMALVPGQYRLTIYLTVAGGIADWINNACAINVEGGLYYKTGRLPSPGQGIVLMDHSVDFVLGDARFRTEATEDFIPVSRVRSR